MEAQSHQSSGGGGGTEATGEGEDEESSSSSSSSNKNTVANSDELLRFRPLHEDESQQQQNESGEVRGEGTTDKGHIENKNNNDSSSKDPESVLEQFRQEWRHELNQAAAGSAGGSKTSSRDGSPSLSLTSGIAAADNSRSFAAANTTTSSNKKAEVDIFEQASRLFQQGIDFERRSIMHDAVRCYRQAMLLVPDIERRLANAVVTSGRTYAMVASSGSAEGSGRTTNADDEIEQTAATTEELIEIFRRRLLDTNGGTALCTPASKKNEDGDDEDVEDSNDADKTRTSDAQEFHISQLPAEVLMHIFKWVVSSELDARQLEQLSMVCCGFYIVARDPELWRQACLKMWGVRLGALDFMVYPTWRQMFIERPHVWFNGVYISKITYVRHGEQSFQDQFYRPWHLVVYYRYLRFFHDGTMLMLTTPDDPSTVLSSMKWRQTRLQGVLKGTYRLVGHDCVAGVLTRKSTVDNNNNAGSPYSRTRIVKQPNDLMEHVFSLLLNISSIKNRRHVQLCWSKYEVCARYRNGQTAISKFDLCDQKFPPLYFSRVKSFSSYSEQSL